MAGFIRRLWKRVRLMAAAWRVWWPWWLDIALWVVIVSAIVGCKPHETVVTDSRRTVEVRRDTVRLWHRDSVRVVDSVFVMQEARGDTVYVTKTAWRYRDRVTCDTVYKVRSDTVLRVDSVAVPVPQERTAARWERRLATIGKAAAGIGIGLASVTLAVWWYRRKKG